MRRHLAAAMLTAVIALSAIAVAGSPGLAHAQTLRIALREDADLLDPTLARTYVGRIVFAGLCDKLFDIDEKLQIVPQLATGYEWADPKTLLIHLRQGVMFQDGEAMDAAAVKYTLDRDLTLPGSFRRSEISADRPRRCCRSADGAGRAEVAVRRVPGATDRPRRDDRFAEGGDAGGQGFRPAPGLHRAVPASSSGCRRTTSRWSGFRRYWDAKDIHFDSVIYQVIVDSSARLANLKAGAVDLSEYIVPTDAAAVKADPKLRLVVSDSLGYFGITNNLANGAAADNPYGRTRWCGRRSAWRSTAQALVNVVFNGMYVPTMQAVPAALAVLRRRPEGAGARRGEGQGAAGAGRGEDAGAAGTDGGEQSRRASRPPR